MTRSRGRFGREVRIGVKDGGSVPGPALPHCPSKQSFQQGTDSLLGDQLRTSDPVFTPSASRPHPFSSQLLSSFRAVPKLPR
jgi:hypothetical protein